MERYISVVWFGIWTLRHSRSPTSNIVWPSISAVVPLRNSSDTSWQSASVRTEWSLAVAPSHST
jgi:hypothetical protein